MAMCLSSACAEEPADALDADVVSALATLVGDAVGIEPSGVYAVELNLDDCGCRDVGSQLSALSLCHSGTPGGNVTLQSTFDVVVSDGIIDLSTDAVSANPVGALDADGTFDAGAVMRVASLAATGFQITRVDGTVSPQGDNDFTVDGRLQMRIVGRLELIDLDGIVTGIEEIDCVEMMSFTGSRYIVR